MTEDKENRPHPPEGIRPIHDKRYSSLYGALVYRGKGQVSTIEEAQNVVYSPTNNMVKSLIKKEV